MDWNQVFEGLQWGFIMVLFWKGAKNENRIDGLEDKK